MSRAEASLDVPWSRRMAAAAAGMRVESGWRGGVEMEVRFGGRERVRIGTGGRGRSLYRVGLLCGAEGCWRACRERMEVLSRVFRRGAKLVSSHCLALFNR